VSETGLGSGDDLLIDAARSYFAEFYQNPSMIVNAEVDKDLSWKPSLHFKANDHLTVVVEASDAPYPRIFEMRRQDVIRLHRPVSVYCVCPEESYLSDQSEAKRLISDGYGLLTVDAMGKVQKRESCIPLLQQITRQEFAAEIKPLPQKIRALCAEAFDGYNHNAPAGTGRMAEIIEGLILKAGRDAVKRTWLVANDATPGQSQNTLTKMQTTPQFQNVKAAIGAVQGYVSEYRNLSHHWPKDKKHAAKKYRDCRHGFLDGLKKVVMFREAMRKIGLSGGL
jgi:hypothetical protein